MPKNYINRKPAILFLFVIALVLCGIIYLKSNSNVPEMVSEQDSIATDNVAIPDTSLAPDVRSAVADTVPPARPDTMERDSRPADEAGAEDGYWNGYYDGVAGREMTENDVTCNFPTQKERDDYASNYTEGYRRGYAEGSHEKP